MFVEVRPILRPAAGALLESVTVPTLGVPPTTLVGARVRPVRVGATMLKVAVLVFDPTVPVIVTLSFVATPTVVTVKVADVAPAAIETVAGTFASELLEERATEAPVLPAA